MPFQQAMQGIAGLSAKVFGEEEKKKKKGPQVEANKAGNPSQKTQDAENLIGSTIAGGSTGGIAGAAIGAGASLVDRNAAKKAAERAENRPKRRGLTAAMGEFQKSKDKRTLALATLSQAVFDWAARIR